MFDCSYDFLVKGFICRMRAIMRRKSPQSYFSMSTKSSYTDEKNPIIINSAVRQLQFGIHIIQLTRREFSLFSYMHRHMNQFLSRKELLEQVWSDRTIHYERTVDAYIKRIRNKIQTKKAHSFALIKTIRGSGYCLLAPYSEYQ